MTEDLLQRARKRWEYAQTFADQDDDELLIRDLLARAEAAEQQLQALQQRAQELERLLLDGVEDLEARWDMRDPRTNPGIRDWVARARASLTQPGAAGQAQIDFNTITRIEVIDERGRQFSRWSCSVEPSVQDQGRTLKLFLQGNSPGAAGQE